MVRPVRYRNADDLFANCTIRDECFIWPPTSSPIPVLGANAPMAQKFCTTSVARILFAICKFPPASTRLTRLCNSRYCVNPFHFTEALPIHMARARAENPYSPLPFQLSSMHLTFPPKEELEKMRPTNPIYADLLNRSAQTMAKGYEDKKPVSKLTALIRRRPDLEGRVRYADDKPLFSLKPKPVAPPPPQTGDTLPTAPSEITLDEMAARALPPSAPPRTASGKDELGA